MSDSNTVQNPKPGSPEPTPKRPNAGLIRANNLSKKIFILTGLLLLSSVPRWYVEDIISERRSYESTAIESVVGRWAQRHTVGNLVLEVPYTYPLRKNDLGQVEMADYKKSFSPESLKIEVKDTFEVRERGIFKIPIYKSQVKMTAEFEIPNDVDPDIKDDKIRPDKLAIFIATKQVDAITEFAAQQENRKLPISREKEGFQVSLSDLNLKSGQSVKLEVLLSLNGYAGIDFQGEAGVFEVIMDSQWKHPSFRGQLPFQQNISEPGFRAEWKIYEPSLEQSISVDYVNPVSHYTQSERAIKYGFLICLLFLSVLFLMELRSKIHIQAMQYLLMTLPFGVFYILLVALSEQVGFNISYVIATVAIILLVVSYFRGIGAGQSKAFTAGGVLAFVYSMIYTMLVSEDYALLIGAICLFVCLAAFMMLTKGINWESASATSKGNHEVS